MPYIDIADKDTLDRAYLGVSDIQNKLGTTSDSGGGGFYYFWYKHGEVK